MTLLTFLLCPLLAAPNESDVVVELQPFLQAQCADCHSDGADEGGFELSSLTGDVDDRTSFARWQRVYDRVHRGEMPPEDADRPPVDEMATFLGELRAELVDADRRRVDEQGRVTARRLNRVEFEQTLSDLFGRPLDVASMLPADAAEEGFQTVGAALNISAVQMRSYLEAIDAAIDQSIFLHDRPEPRTYRLSLLNSLNYMQTYRDQISALPTVDGMTLFATEAMSHHNAVWDHFTVPYEGRYRITISTFLVNSDKPLGLTVRAGGTGHKESLDLPSRTLRHLEVEQREPRQFTFEADLLRGHFLHLYPSELPKRRFPKNGKYEQATFDGPGVNVQWMEIEGPLYDEWPPASHETLLGGVRTESIRGVVNEDPNPHLARRPLIPADPRERQEDWPPGGNPVPLLAGPVNEDAQFVARDYSNRRRKVVDKILAGKHPAVDPLPDYDLPPGTPLPSYGGEPIYRGVQAPKPIQRTRQLAPKDPSKDLDRLIRSLAKRAWRGPAGGAEATKYVRLAQRWLDDGVSFEDALRTGYQAVLTSPRFLYRADSLDQDSDGPRQLDDWQLAERLAMFLWNTAPDEPLRRDAAAGRLGETATLNKHVARMLRDDRSDRFVRDFLGQWLDLYRIDDTAPDLALYPEYDPVLRTAMVVECEAFFRHMIDANRPAAEIVQSDYVTINRRLAELYGLEAGGEEPSVVRLPDDSVRGGLLTTAAVLKVTANGTNTSPVIRGKWVLERLLGQKPDPPPPGIPAVEPDIRGAVTIRDQLEKHRNIGNCASCHKKIDPPGVALESFDPVGRYRTNYRILRDDYSNFDKRQLKPRYREGLPVDPSYQMPDGHEFADIRQLKELLAEDEAGIAHVLVDRLITYAVGAPPTIGDEDAITAIVEQSAADGYGVRSILEAVITSDLFRE